MNRYACALFFATALPVLISSAIWPHSTESSQSCVDTPAYEVVQAIDAFPAPPEPSPEILNELASLRQELEVAIGLLEKSFDGPVQLEHIQTTPVTLTAYSSTPDQCDSTPHITASNKPVRHGVIAVSDDIVKELGIRFGQRVLIPGHGIFEVQDRMNPRWHRRVDIWHADREAARLFGKQKGTILWVADAPEKNEEEKEGPLIAMADAVDS